MLDEPSQGLAPLIVQDVFKIIVAARDEGISVLLVEQNVRAAVEIADRAYVLDDGRIVYEGARAPSAPTRSGCARSPAPAPRNGTWTASEASLEACDLLRTPEHESLICRHGAL